MRLHFILFLSIFFFSSCKEVKKKRYKIVNNNGITAKGYVINDTLFDGTVFYYNENNTLIRTEFFKEGKIEGLSTEYHSNGLPKIQTNYSAGKKNGVNAYFDSSGKCFYMDNYYYDLVVGPIIFFKNNEIPKRFFFANLQNETLIDIDYQSWNGVKDIIPNCINYTYNFERHDSTDQVSLLLYLISPPKFSFNYSILKVKRKSASEFSVVTKLENGEPFKNLVLPILPDSMYYSISLDIFDSILNKKTIVYKEVW